MAWTTLLDSIKSYIKQNRNQEITGTVLQNVLVNMVNQLGANMTYAGLATPTTNPGVPNGPTFYIAVSAGTYTNFNGIKVAENEIALLNFYNDTWSKDTLMATTGVGQPGTGEGAEVFNDYGANTAAGTFSHAEGEDTAASGEAAHAEGTEEFVLVYQGALEITLGSTGRERYTVPRGSAIHYCADQPHTYRNAADALTRAAMVISYPKK